LELKSLCQKTTSRMMDVLFSPKRSHGYPSYHRLLAMYHHPFLHIFPHQLFYTADPIMSAGRDSFYSALESIIDSVSFVFYLTARLFLLRRRGGAVREFGRRNTSRELVRVFWWWRRGYDWNMWGKGRQQSCCGPKKRNRLKDIWNREMNGYSLRVVCLLPS